MLWREASMLLAFYCVDGTRAQPEAPYPESSGWLPLVYEHTADGYDNHDEHYQNKGECLPGSTVKLRGHIQCVSGNQEWCAIHCGSVNLLSYWLFVRARPA